MATYKTPGVYVEEIPKLPPSIAQVETAIPAFIGYTEKAMELTPDDLLLKKPRRIGSLIEYEQFFGYGPSPSVTEINIDANNNFLSASVNSSFYLYDSLRMFYANGGGDCFIVSVGKYDATVSDTSIIAGITLLEKEDDPTIILTPDAVALGDSALANVQVAALTQCNNLQDRVSVLDLKENDPKGVNFRNNVGVSYLSYGAAYTPWLKVTLPKAIRYTDIVKTPSVIKRNGAGVTLDALTADQQVKDIITAVGLAYADKKKITDQTIALGLGDSNLWKNFDELESDFVAANTNTSLEAIFAYVYSIALKIDSFLNGGSALQSTALKTTISNSLALSFVQPFTEVSKLEEEGIADFGMTGTDISALPATWNDVKNATASDDIDDAIATDNEKRLAALNLLKPMFDEINRAYITIVADASANLAKTLDDSLALAFPAYKAIITGISNSMTTMPPSGAVAGVYAAVDRNRGVWKAPANVSLTRVLGPSTTFTRTELDALNVDATSGKSINAIRTFFGKGTLIFGARTLSGNDNEWRYISVRRFFNMVEESSKKASEMFVFEPNDANTWVKVQGMIENFLITLWRQGALQGAKPEHAFYVAVGLGKTMTALDILEGRMIVEIGMAVVRPAEFIILRFSHKMAES